MGLSYCLSLLLFSFLLSCLFLCRVIFNCVCRRCIWKLVCKNNLQPRVFFSTEDLWQFLPKPRNTTNPFNKDAKLDYSPLNLFPPSPFGYRILGSNPKQEDLTGPLCRSWPPKFGPYLRRLWELPLASILSWSTNISFQKPSQHCMALFIPLAYLDPWTFDPFGPISFNQECGWHSEMASQSLLYKLRSYMAAGASGRPVGIKRRKH